MGAWAWLDDGGATERPVLQRGIYGIYAGPGGITAAYQNDCHCAVAAVI